MLGDPKMLGGTLLGCPVKYIEWMVSVGLFDKVIFEQRRERSKKLIM